MDKQAHKTIITLLLIILLGVAYLVISNTSLETNSENLGAQVSASLKTGAPQKGSAGLEVVNLQNFLVKEGVFKGKVDGVFGAGTEDAVKAFQKKYGLPPSGIVGGDYVADPSCDIDVNNDGVINTSDLTGLMAAFGSQGLDLDYDLNNDGLVSAADLTLLLQYFGQEIECALLSVEMVDVPLYYNADILGNYPTDLQLFDFVLEAVGGDDILVSQIPVLIDIDDVLGSEDDLGVSAVVNSLTLSDNQGNSVTVDVQAAEDNDVEIFYFDFSTPIEIDAGGIVNFSLEANIKPLNDDFVEGTEIHAFISDDYVDNIQAESVQNGILSEEQIYGDAFGDFLGLFREGINVEFTSSSVSSAVVEGNGNDIGTLVINFDVTAFGEGMLIPTDANLIASSWLSMPGIASDIDEVRYGILTTMNGTNYVQEGSEMASEFSSVLTSDADIVQGHYHIEEGETESFQLTVTKVNDGEDTGLYRMYLTGIPWIGDDWFDNQEVEYYYIYKYLEEYNTSHLYLN